MFIDRGTTYFPNHAPLRRLLRHLVPNLGFNLRSKKNFGRLAKTLAELSRRPRVLVLGAGHGGAGMEVLERHGPVELIKTDVSLGPGIDVICDAHDLPFLSETFDGVIAQAVLEHVLDPYRCVQEIHRVLRPGGLVYAETPFMQQVHGGSYDFTRFTFLGHRRLFRMFEEIAAGSAGGPATVLAWSYEYLLLSFVRNRPGRAGVRIFARFTAFWLKYIDLYLIARPAALDAAWGYFFFGRKAQGAISDRDLLRLYWQKVDHR
jgi:SAM-dependent methyltransferase